jgi:hypothetical protein
MIGSESVAQPERPAAGAAPGGLTHLRVWTWSTPLRRCLTIAFAWRLIMAVWGVIAHFLLPHGKFTSFSLLRHGWSHNVFTYLIDAGVRNDAVWYARVAQHGYTYSTHATSSIAFYPLFPALIKVVSLLVGNVYTAGMLISTLCLFGSAALLFAWMDHRQLGGRAPLVVAMILIFPWAVFYAAMYTESLYLCLLLASFVCWDRRRFALAALFVALLVLTRPTGIIVVPCLFLLYIQARPRQWRQLLPSISGVIALAAFALYQYIVFGTPFASARAAGVAPWSRSLSTAASDLLLRPRPGFPSWSPYYIAAMILIAFLALAVVPAVYRRLGPAYGLLAALSILMPAATGFVSIERYIVVDFPLFVVLALIWKRTALLAYFTFNVYLLLFFSAAFVAGWGVF